MGRINEYGQMMNCGDQNMGQEQVSEKSTQELEVFINGGGDGSLNYKFKKANLDFSKMQGSADGAIMLRVNVPVTDGQAYAIQIPKKLVGV